MTLDLKIDVAYDGVDDSSQDRLVPVIKKAILHAEKAAGIRYMENAELSILLTNDAIIQRLNRQWRSKNTPTNVLSFPADELQPGEPGGFLLGDIAISIETAHREAELENKSFDDHFTHLIIHGFLHLFGYDHETDEQAHQMESLETVILGELGISDPYESEQTQ